ncbi:MAG: hypothetical protein FWF43_03475 [Propionibacteriaceae bacterium]|nr:hypothetical protein [Propionibacteriaceae bacterium]
MRIDRFHFTKRFLKQYDRLNVRQQAKVQAAINQARDDLTFPGLRLHQLKGEYDGTQSISAGGDLRLHFELHEENGQTIASLQAVGTHSQLYG